MLSPGQDLFEYRIICLLGQGAFGVVRWHQGLSGRTPDTLAGALVKG